MKYYLLALLLSLTSIDLSFSQAKSSTETYYKLFDSFFEYDNSSVFNGLEYVDHYPGTLRTIETNNKFYKSFNFQKGFVIYDGQPYYDLKMKYDLLNDLVILEYVNKKVNYLSLNSTIINQFELMGGKFIRLENNPVLNSIYGNGFFEEKYKGKLSSLYIKHKKNKFERLRGKTVSYVFKTYKFYVVNIKDEFYRIDSKKDILKALPFKEKEIRAYYSKNKVVLRKDKDLFLVGLLKSLDASHLSKISK
ncbi:hypothetical protein Q4Q39_08060 [Flavivirga amylovorans]|uniref:Uncharacterized protein n=1 Tax=Flavivirga amylovorans TaxID=870486 RepID=A0ABT8X085_9FLAO|nr:hypothetical protein [Flavivirga amylovorans]MDO5987347.1 hypothetical protein [Flavivirga amylovorans]